MAARVVQDSDCSICLETLSEPKALQCGHAFCRKCLEEQCKDFDPDEEIVCPLCRKKSTIPSGGCINLPDKFFIAESTDNENTTENIRCELCLNTESENTATSYCIDCEQHICDRCSVFHKRSKASNTHQVVRNVTKKTSEEEINSRVSYCDQHPGERNRLFCWKCQCVLCDVCFLKTHNGHDWMSVSESADLFLKELREDGNRITESSARMQQKIDDLEIEKKGFLKKFLTAQNEVSEECDKLISLVRTHKRKFTEELTVFKDKIVKQIDIKINEIEIQLAIRESFQRYCQDLMSKGTACDVSRTAHDLHARAEELVTIQDEADCHKLSGVEITFKPCRTTAETVKNFIGELALKADVISTTLDDRREQKMSLTAFLNEPSLFHVMPGNVVPGNAHVSPIAGIAVLGSEVFVVKDTSLVYVYKHDDFTSIRNLTITGSKSLAGLVSCSHYNCLYAVDAGQKIIYRYDLTSNVITNWSVGGICYALSLTRSSSIIAALYDTDKIQEYTTHGSLIKEISLDSSIDCPYHCIRLSTGNYVVSHEGSKQHRVCIVDQAGRIIQSYGAVPGSGVGQLNCPRDLAVNAHDNVLVSDSENNRVQLFSPTLTHLGDVVIPGQQLKYPYGLHFDELNNRLYIGEDDDNEDDEDDVSNNDEVDNDEDNDEDNIEENDDNDADNEENNENDNDDDVGKTKVAGRMFVLVVNICDNN